MQTNLKEEELGKFWFEMYQRVKKEVGSQRKAYAELLAKSGEKEEEIEKMKVKVANEKGQSENSEKESLMYLQQI